MNTSNNKPYWRFQFAFWIGYLLLNLVYAGAWGLSGLGYVGIFGLLSGLLFGVTHGLHWLYQQRGKQLGMVKVCLQLLWLLPAVAIVVQVVFALLIWATTSRNSLATMVGERFSSGSFIVYSINTALILLIWCLICLFWAEWKRRQNAEREHWQNQARLKELELQFLRSQINSHFLFNTLNNIRALVLEDATAARQAMSDLATLLRGVLHESKAAVVPLRQELALVNGYLALEALQLEGRLQFALEVPPVLEAAQLPPMLLQTLVENAIRHGIARRSAGGVVHLSAHTLPGGRWRVQVSNPPAESGPAPEGHGIGLANARERLRMAFGTEATLELTEGSPVVAVVEMPLWIS